MYYTYILTTSNGKVMYIGVTNDLMRRVNEHKAGAVEGFTKKYNVKKLVYFEEYNEVTLAIEREKQIKGWARSKKNALVESINPEWKELTYDGSFVE